MDFRGVASYFIIIFNLLVLFYFAALNTIYLVLFSAALVESIRYRRRARIVDLYEVFRSPLTPSISVLIPAFNEAATIIESVRSVLLLRYPHFEVVVINDGSSDDTLDLLIERYKMRRISKVVPSLVPCEQIRGVYISEEHDNLIVVDKENGGKSDALNAGINVSRHDLVCVIDADSIIEPEGLLKVARPFIEHPGSTVAVGGLVRIVNGCNVVGGHVVEVRLPRGFLVNMQIVEYLRAFLGGRMGWSALKSLLIISGAFGLFNRELVIAVGGYRKETVGEDMDLVVRMHRHLRRAKRDYRMIFVPDPVCWTDAPEKYRELARQRDRWQRGLIESLGSNLGMLFNPRYGVIGLFAVPYFFFFEMIGPFVEILGYFAVVLAFWLGFVNMQFFWLFLSLAFLYAIVVSLFAVLLEGIALQHFPKIKSLLKLAFFSIVENFGYRQVNSWWRTKAFFTYHTRREKWEPGERKAVREGAPEERPRRWLRYAVVILIPLLALAIVLPLKLTSKKETGNFLSEIPSPVEIDGTRLAARTEGKYLELSISGGWEEFLVKGANIGTALPGKWFSQFPADEDLYWKWFEQIAAMNANTIRIYTLLDPVFYSTLDEFNRSSGRKLMLLQEIWPDDEVPGNNLYDPEYTESYHREISLDLEALMGDAEIPERKGRAWGTYDSDMSPYLLGILIGREIVWEEASTTNALNPDKSSYQGMYVRTSGDANAIETWLAETCDYAVAEMQDKYGWQVPVSFVSWPTLDPMRHPTEYTPGRPKEDEHEDAETLDPNHLEAGPEAEAGLFACYHIYPYYPDFMNREPEYAEYRDEQGEFNYGGYLRQFMEIHPDYPALIGEFGISTSLGIAHYNPQGLNHGGVSEGEQGAQIARMMDAIVGEGYAGGVIFEWGDEWAKRAWVDMAYMIPFDRHIYWHNLMDPEQNFGIMAYEPDHQPFEGGEKTAWRTGENVEEDGTPVSSLSIDHNEAFLYLQLELDQETVDSVKPGGSGNVELLVGIDTFGNDNGTTALPVEGLPALPTGVEFLLKIDSEGALLLARPDYNRGDSKFAAAPGDDPDFVPIRYEVNRMQASEIDGTVFEPILTDDSVLNYGEYDPYGPDYDSQGHWYMDESENKLNVRLPWLLLNVSDPSSSTVLHDTREDLPAGPAALRVDYNRDALGTEQTGGFLFYVVTGCSGRLADFQPRLDGGWVLLDRYSLPYWEEPRYRERLKKSYEDISILFESIE